MTEEKLEKICRLFDGFSEHTHKVHLYDFQRELSHAILRTVFLNTGEDWYAQIARQAGKTETVVAVLEFLMIFFPKITGRPFRVGIFAPQKEQTKTDFDRLKARLLNSYKEGYQVVVSPEESNSVTLQLANGSYCYAFPLTATSNPESKTLDFCVYEEANKITDKEKKDKSDPMRSSTNGGSLSCGVAGYHANYFKRAVDRGINVLRYDDRKVVEQKQAAFEKDGNSYHLNYGRFIEKLVAEIGEDDESFQTQYRLNWKIGGGNFCTADQLHALRGNFKQQKTENAVTVGLDSAKFPDKWIVTVKDIVAKRIVGWLRLQGDNYEDMFHATVGWLEKRYPNVELIAIDSTGQGDFVPDMFDNHTDYDILRVKFSLQSKDAIYKNLSVQVKNQGTRYPTEDTKECREFEQEMLDLEKEYKGEYLSCHHPDESGAHDDYPDSWALAEWAHRQLLENEPDVDVVSVSSRKRKMAVHSDEDDDLVA